MIGGPSERTFDYRGVSTFNSWANYFSAFEIYVNGAGMEKGHGSTERCRQL
jgi:hypothetical protein